MELSAGECLVIVAIRVPIAMRVYSNEVLSTAMFLRGFKEGGADSHPLHTHAHTFS